MVVEGLLLDDLSKMDNMGELQTYLENISCQSRTCKLWINNLIKPVLFMMLFVRVEREDDWPLHLYAVSKMISYFFCCRPP